MSGTWSFWMDCLYRENLLFIANLANLPMRPDDKADPGIYFPATHPEDRLPVQTPIQQAAATERISIMNMIANAGWRRETRSCRAARGREMGPAGSSRRSDNGY